MRVATTEPQVVRIERVSDLNGAIANVPAAETRAELARAALATAEGVIRDACERQQTARARVLADDIDSQTRLDALRDFEDAIDSVTDAAHELHRARVENGTAQQQLEAAREKVRVARGALEKVLPEVRS